MPDTPGEKEEEPAGKESKAPGEQKGARGHDEARITPSDLANKKFVDNLVINIKSDLILITEDKARLCLRDGIDFMAQRNEWHAPAGVLATLATVMLTTKPVDALHVPADTWRAVGIMATGLCAFWLIKSLIKLDRSQKPNVDTIIVQMKQRSVKGQP